MRSTRASCSTTAPYYLPLLLVLALLLTPTSALSLPRIFTRRAVLHSSSRPISSSSTATLPPGTSLAGDFACRSTGECSPCPANELGSPVCKVYGNRRALTCVLLNPSSNSPSSFHTSSDRTPPPPSPNQPTNSEEEEEEEWKPVLPDEATVEEALELDPDPEGLDDEDLQDALRGEADEEGEREREREARRRRRRAEGMERRQVQEVYTWEACTRVVSRERGDFFEFVLCNIFFATVSVAVLIYRHRALASRQYGTLAARIGMSVS
ncbi:hypothetical protein BCR35DRAFT_302328 [Leucosporidium creatinivorum]|uniref:Uncharacterized protein n=1 Tax=Leucosporidium creatinivorum TaxID=106004 RepID=A0A1Y2FVD3_9BASI|nr:hypothetical protein BCR35DRAFT_302328 [Leucosporidium creatinivorum]